MNFHRAAAVYDATRALPAQVLERIVDCILSVTGAGPDTHFLDLGVGTGRFALPLLEHGCRVTGIDLSDQMMERLREKVGHTTRLTLLIADARSLPFPDHSFDVVLAMQVLPLIPEWRTVLDEARRLLKPTGSFVLGSNRAMPGPYTDIRRQWRLLVQSEGGQQPPESGVFDQARSVIAEMTGHTEVVELIQWTSDIAPITVLEAIRTHTFSDSWNLPDEVMDRVQHHLLKWATRQYGDLDRPLPATFGFAVAISAL